MYTVYVSIYTHCLVLSLLALSLLRLLSSDRPLLAENRDIELQKGLMHREIDPDSLREKKTITIYDNR